MTAKLIPLENLIISLVPLILVGLIFYKWEIGLKKLLLACTRMFVQLITIGYLLKYIFELESPATTLPIILFMLTLSAWISLHNIPTKRKNFFKYAVLSLVLGALPNLIFTAVFLIPTTKWYSPSFIIPLAGMIFSQAMNILGLCSERLESEVKNKNFFEARKLAYKASLIPIINTFMAVGLVSLPGLMTGQILAGVSPLIAVRYQLLIMTMLLGAGGLTSFFYLKFVEKEYYSISKS